MPNANATLTLVFIFSPAVSQYAHLQHKGSGVYFEYGVDKFEINFRYFANDETKLCMGGWRLEPLSRQNGYNG
jgi:hypothetical protein